MDAQPTGRELLIELVAVILEYPVSNLPSLHPPYNPQREGILSVLQQPAAVPNGSPHDVRVDAFISFRSANIPLLKRCFAERVSSQLVKHHHSTAPPATYLLRFPNRTLVIHLHPETEPELVSAFWRVLQWFCSTSDPRMQSDPRITVEYPESEYADSVQQPNDPSTYHRNDSFTRLGDHGVALVSRVGTRLNARIEQHFSARIDRARATETDEEKKKDVKLGGKATSALLGGTRKVVGVGAKVASGVTTKVSNVVANGMSNSSVARSFRESKEGTLKKKIHTTISGSLEAAGRIFVAADEQGQKMLRSTGEGSESLAREKYGEEAAAASRNMAGIAIDGYRIARFPQKLGATAVLKGAVKSKMREADAKGVVRQSEPQGVDVGVPPPPPPPQVAQHTPSWQYEELTHEETGTGSSFPPPQNSVPGQQRYAHATYL